MRSMSVFVFGARWPNLYISVMRKKAEACAETKAKLAWHAKKHLPRCCWLKSTFIRNFNQLGALDGGLGDSHILPAQGRMACVDINPPGSTRGGTRISLLKEDVT